MKTRVVLLLTCGDVCLEFSHVLKLTLHRFLKHKLFRLPAFSNFSEYCLSLQFETLTFIVNIKAYF